MGSPKLNTSYENSFREVKPNANIRLKYDGFSPGQTLTSFRSGSNSRPSMQQNQNSVALLQKNFLNQQGRGQRHPSNRSPVSRSPNR